MSRLAEGRDFPPEATPFVAGVVVVGCVLVVISYFVLKVLQDRAYRRQQEEERSRRSAQGASPTDGS